jgi:hypothetical protein
MRLPLIAPADLSSEQREVYEDMRAGIEKSFQGFKSVAENGALIGPWDPWRPIAFELRFEAGYEEAREWLYWPTTQEELDRLCQKARASRDEAA